MNKLKLINLWLDLGEALLLCGAEVNRVEDTIIRLGKAYNTQKTEIFVITSNIVVTATFSDTEQYTSSRRINGASETDFVKLEKLNQLSRNCCKNPYTVEKLEAELKKILSVNISTAKLYIGSFLASGSFAVFFGGKIIDGIVAAVMGVISCFLSRIISKSINNRVAFYIIISFLTGIFISLLGIFFPILATDKIMIGVIMLLIPGIVLTNAVRDILIGDTISGVLKLIQCLLWAFTIAGGFIIADQTLGRLI